MQVLSVYAKEHRDDIFCVKLDDDKVKMVKKEKALHKDFREKLEDTK